MALNTTYDMTIGGRSIAGAGTFEVLNPATGEVVAMAPDASRAQLDAAVGAARKAFPAWAGMAIEKRAAVLDAMGERILANVDELKALLTSEQGKPLAEAEGEVIGAGYWLKGAAALELKSETIDSDPARRIETQRIPIGVVGAIAPWNFPLVLAMFKVGPALLAGNTMVLKPSPFTPLSTLRIAALVADLLPPGVLNVVTGGDQLGPWMTEHPGIDKVSFTGSTATGRRVMQSAAATLKRITLELGGNDPAVVLPDIDLETMVPNLFWSAFRNNGQICIATKRMYVHADIYDRFLDAYVAYARSVKVANGASEGAQLGPINNRPQYDRIRALTDDCVTRGYRTIATGSAGNGPGLFAPPVIVDRPPDDSRIVAEEQFGPILPILQYSSIDDVVARSNASEFGLGASVWGTDEDAALAVARRMESGTIWINDSQYLNPAAAFGGLRQSGFGVEGGWEGLMEYTSAQTLIRHAATS